MIDKGSRDVIDYIGLSDTSDTMEFVETENEYNLSESGETDGYGEISAGDELGQFANTSQNERLARVDGMGYVQPQTSNTPHTKSIHRSGVSAETLTSSGQIVEQATIKEQNKLEGYNTEFFVTAKQNGINKTRVFTTSNTMYYS